MATDFSYCPRITVDGSSLLSGPFGWRAFSSDASKLLVTKYENDVIKLLKKVYDSTWTATAVIDALFTAGQENGTKVVIVPLSAGLANAGANSYSNAGPSGATLYRGLRDDPNTPEDERYETMSSKGTGSGSSSRIEFNPNDTDAEKTIVHELLHSLREMRGQLNQKPTEMVLAQYENEEEFFAMLVGNIFLSEMGRVDLRASHIVYKLLTNEQKTSAGFLGDNAYGKACRRLVNKFVCDNYDVAMTIKQHVPTYTKFNPIREYLLNTGSYPLY